MAVPVLLNTARGTYRLTVVEQTVADAGGSLLTLAVEHAGGLEKFALRCDIAPVLLRQAGVTEVATVSARLAPWLEGQFEQIRETALKSIRSERRLAQYDFDEARPGPFQAT